jgi:hypothetical protein
MTPKNKNILKIGVILMFAGLLIGGGVVLYLFNMPHRNVQEANADYSLTSSAIVAEYLENTNAANEKYLADDGNSTILEITGTVFKISEDFNKQQVVLLKNDNDKAGVSCTFTAETNSSASALKVGQEATIKGVIRTGASYDEDLEMYENVVLEKCSVSNLK